MKYENSLAFATAQDETDPLTDFRKKFYIPLFHGKPSIYFTGNSLGLQPVSSQDYIHDFLQDWANLGVEGHFHGKNPWVSYHEIFPAQLSKLTGSREDEVIVMNQLTVNLHILLTSFYRPNRDRYKIICEGKTFPSDQYALESQVRLHGLEPSETIIQLNPREGENSLRTSDILTEIGKHANTLALVIFGGVNYYTGEVMDMRTITEAAHVAGAYSGFDLAHAIGNISLQLHDWEVDFACWCSYKYLNSGPGGVAGAYIHEKHARNVMMPRLAGWWGHDKASRFKMGKEFHPIPTAEGWQLSNAPVLNMAVHKSAIDIFDEAGMDRILKKSTLLTGFLFYVLDEIIKLHPGRFEIITPREEGRFGCQVSMLITTNGKEIFNVLQNNGVIADWREPDVIRIAPVPLYNTFEEVFRFGEIMLSAITN